MNFLLLGLGSIGKRHAAILRGLGHSVTTVDTDPEAGADYQRWGSPGVARLVYKGLLDCTPPDVRVSKSYAAPIVRFVEKPLGNITRFPIYKEPIMMGFCYHWDEFLREFVQIVKGAQIHRLEIRGGQYLQDWHAEDYREVKHRYRGVITDSLSHSIYVARWILGRLELDGYTYGNTGQFDIEPEDHAAVLLTGPNDETVYLYADYLLRPRRFSIDAYAIGRHYHWEFATKHIDAMYERQMQAFVDLCAGKLKDGYPNLEDGIAVQRILDAIA
jgi:predicted dehydrogenase